MIYSIENLIECGKFDERQKEVYVCSFLPDGYKIFHGDRVSIGRTLDEECSHHGFSLGSSCDFDRIGNASCFMYHGKNKAYGKKGFRLLCGVISEELRINIDIKGEGLTLLHKTTVIPAEYIQELGEADRALEQYR